MAKGPKNGISIGGYVLPWQDFSKALEEWKLLAESVNQGHLNRGFLQSLKELGTPWGPQATEANAEMRFRSLGQLHYACRRRNWPATDWPLPLGNFIHLLQTEETLWPRVSLIATLASWTTKSVEETVNAL